MMQCDLELFSRSTSARTVSFSKCAQALGVMTYSALRSVSIQATIVTQLSLMEPEMDFVTVREFRTQPAKVWKKLEAGKDIVVTRNGKPFALLTFTEPDRVEENILAIRQARIDRSLADIRLRAKELGLDKMTMDEINAEIAAARRERRARKTASRA